MQYITMIDEWIRKDSEGTDFGLIEIVSRNSPRGTEESQDSHDTRYSGRDSIPVLPNASQRRWANFLGGLP
jgi:hypothetical protein